MSAGASLSLGAGENEKTVVVALRILETPLLSSQVTFPPAFC